ncbi:retinol dehydrogenase 1 isoform X2 [Vanacampus margaritifer]
MLVHPRLLQDGCLQPQARAHHRVRQRFRPPACQAAGWQRFPRHRGVPHRDGLGGAGALGLPQAEGAPPGRNGRREHQGGAGVCEQRGGRARRLCSSPGLWGLVNNAGRSTPIGPAEWMHLEDFTTVLDVNLLGTIDVTLHFLPLLKKARGRVVNVASIMGRLALTGGGYCLSKWGVEAFSDSLRRDMQHFGIKVSIIEPGFFKTNMTRLDLIEADLKRLWTRLPRETKRSYGQTYFDDYVKSQAFSMDLLCSRRISTVTSCMEHALTARFPRTRYAAGWDAKLLWIPLSYLPSFASDFVISSLLPSPAAAAARKP